ncbi:hypothetical protein FXB41_12375 [Bradyrhizobium canariense]|nr:hypothetical protein [Bradyrhizobium canariense]
MSFPPAIDCVARRGAVARCDRRRRAFSSEVDTGSRTENASKQESRARRCRSRRCECGSRDRSA